jgi:hypothetical protein
VIVADVDVGVVGIQIVVVTDVHSATNVGETVISVVILYIIHATMDVNIIIPVLIGAYRHMRSLQCAA